MYIYIYISNFFSRHLFLATCSLCTKIFTYTESLANRIHMCIHAHMDSYILKLARQKIHAQTDALLLLPK